MRKSADVVIRMQQNFNLEQLFPQKINWEEFKRQQPLIPFAHEVVEYLNALSTSLLKDRRSRNYPDVVTFAFFCRRANILANKQKYIHEEVLRIGRGVVFHVAPSNVPINFAYSMVAGMLAGNLNIVRVSSKIFPQVDLVIEHINQLSDEYPIISKTLAIIRYDRTSDATSFFSSFSAVRVIWGGDMTIANIRKNELPPRSFDVCFADRYSIAVLSPVAILNATDDEMEKVAASFYNDTYLFDQNACSAPHTIFWLNEEKLTKAQDRFWSFVHSLVSQKYNLQPVLSVDKLTAFYQQAVEMDIKKTEMPDNYIIRTELNTLPTDIETFRCAGGYFSEKTIDSLDEIAPIITNRYQTLAYWGIESHIIREFIIRNRLTGLDRIVPFGETTSFALTWDGYNLIDTLSRVISII